MATSPLRSRLCLKYSYARILAIGRHFRKALTSMSHTPGGARAHRGRATVNERLFRMRAIGIMLLIPWMAAAQAGYPPGPPENAALVRGVLLESDAHAAGELSIRAADNRVLRYQFDG